MGAALEVIPRTLAQNCGANVIRTLTKLRAKHVEKANSTFGIDGNKGKSQCTRQPFWARARNRLLCAKPQGEEQGKWQHAWKNVST